MLLWLILFCIVDNVSGGNVILVFPPTKSQLLSGTNMAEILSDAGHKVTILIPTNDEQDIRKSPKYNILFYKTSMSRETEQSIVKQITKISPRDAAVGGFPATVAQMVGERCRTLLFDEEFQAAILKLKPDVAIIHVMLSCFIAFLNHISVPFLDFCPVPLVNAVCGFPHRIPSPPSYVPDGFLPDPPTTFLSRVMNTIIFHGAPVLLPRILMSNAQELVNLFQDKHNQERKGVFELRANSSFLLIHGDFTYESIRPTLPKVVNIGGIQCAKPKPLEPELEDFVSGAGESGVIVFSIGGILESLPETFVEMFFDIFGELPQRVVWRLKNIPPTLKDAIPANVKLVDWMPQQDLLGHPNTKLFITHGGIQGSFESICHGIPSLGVHFNLDQISNIKILMRKGMALHAGDFKSLKKNETLEMIQSILSDPKYMSNALRAQALFHDQPLTVVQRFLFAVEYTLRHKGAHHMTSHTSLELNWMQYNSLDVYLFLFVVFMLVLVLLFCLLKMIVKGCSSVFSGLNKMKKE